MGIFDEKLLERLCSRYKIRYKIFPQTEVLLLDTGLDMWMVKYVGNRDRPYCLMHKNKLRQTKRYHVQRYLTKLNHAIDSIVNHKKVLSSIYKGSQSIHNRNANIKKKGRVGKTN